MIHRIHKLNSFQQHSLKNLRFGLLVEVFKRDIKYVKLSSVGLKELRSGGTLSGSVG